MNLTVGPLPPAVYWRRRALVAGGLLLLVLLVAYSCGGSSGSGSTGQHASRNTAPTGTAPAPPPATDAASEVCADAEIVLTPLVQRIVGGTFAYELTLKIKNT